MAKTWHKFCGKNLRKINNKPPCDTESTWHSHCLHIFQNQIFSPWIPQIKITNKLLAKNYYNFSKLTPLRPIKSARGPLVIAPTIAPKVKMDPNKEYCIQSIHQKAKKIRSNPGLVYLSVKDFGSSTYFFSVIIS